jgi:hypothetical protein
VGGALVAAAALLFLGHDAWSRPSLPLLLLAVAALTKNEGLVAASIVALLVTIRERRNLRRAWLVWAPAALGLCWFVLARYLDATPVAYRVDLLVAGDPAVIGRIQPTLVAMWHTVGPIVAVAGAVAVIGSLLFQRHRRELRLGSDNWLWGLGAAYAMSVAVTYVASPFDLAWHLATSVDRVSSALVLLACVSVACWTASATSVVTTRPIPAGMPAR